ncbi:MAG TPA: class I SAM-dependent methyltransferase [Fimbriimonas sp.]|nr:class I SAM-dependent methyltransferase [Fimbriimonas sp.]
MSEIGGWVKSAGAWIATQKETGDWSRSAILDPCLERILPTVQGLRVLDVGCGEGRYCRVLSRRGANTVGIDPVSEFVSRAKELHQSGDYREAFAEDLPFEANSFDLVVSYLTLVDIPDFRAAIKEMCRVCRPDGRIVVVTLSNLASTTDAWTKDESGRKLYRTVDRYMEEFTLPLQWKGIQIENYHRPLSAILAPFFAAGAMMDGFLEPLPDEADQEYEDEFRVPTFQVMTFRFPNGKRG